MTDDRTADPYHPSRAQAGPLTDRQGGPAEHDAVPGTPAEAQFPYIGTQGIQPTTPTSPPPPEPVQRRFRNRRPPSRRSSRWLPVVIGGAAGLFVLAVLAAYSVWGATGNPISAPTTPGGIDATPAGAVRGYLEALAAADADAALGFALAAPENAALLTDEVLAELMEESPITAIDVPATADQAPFQRVTASYLLGERPVTATFAVFRSEQVWRLEEVAAVVDLGDLPPGEVELMLNGVQLTGSTLALFPGSYTLGSGAPRYRVEPDAFVVESPVAPPEVQATIELSEVGREEVIEAAKAKLKACVKQRKLDPEGCGFALANPKGTKLKESTMRWGVHSGDDELDDLEPALDHPGSATAAVDISVRGEVRGTDGSRWQASVRLNRMRADLTGEKVTVQFGL